MRLISYRKQYSRLRLQVRINHGKYLVSCTGATTEERGIAMRYRIEYADGKCCNFANGRNDLLEWLELLKDETITDIRKLYKNGTSDSVMGKYKQYMGK